MAGVPAPLLNAIAVVESGRPNARTGVWQPWPWTINVEGAGYYFDSKEEAVASVRAWQAKGVRSIDVGCMQVNLMHHPLAFTTLEDAFEPRVNTIYAARFLRSLFDSTSDWTRAAGLYHSATPSLGIPYQQRVMASVSGLPAFRRQTAEQMRRAAVAAAWAATLN